MEFSRRERVVVIFVLFTFLSSLLVLGGIDRQPAPELGAYPDCDNIVQQPDEYQNQQVTCGGQVVSTAPVVIRAESETDAGINTTLLEITDIDTTLERGDTIQVFGVLTGPQTVQATTVVVHPRTGFWYARVISFIAGLWVLGRIIRHWKLDFGTGALLPRSDTSQLFCGGDD